MLGAELSREYGWDCTRIVRFIEMGALPAELLHRNRDAIDQRDAERLGDALRPPPASGKGWRVDADGRPVPPARRARKPGEPVPITRYRSAAERLREAV